MLTLNTQLETFATTQFTNYDFNSLVRFGGKSLGASANGLYELGGELDDTADIAAYFAPVTTDFGVSRPKRLRSLFIGCETTGTLEVGLTVDEGTERIYSALPQEASQQGLKVPVGRDGEGRYWKFLFRNTGGCDFSIDSLEVLPIIRPRRRS